MSGSDLKEALVQAFPDSEPIAEELLAACEHNILWAGSAYLADKGRGRLRLWREKQGQSADQPTAGGEPPNAAASLASAASRQSQAIASGHTQKGGHFQVLECHFPEQSAPSTSRASTPYQPSSLLISRTVQSAKGLPSGSPPRSVEIQARFSSTASPQYTVTVHLPNCSPGPPENPQSSSFCSHTPCDKHDSCHTYSLAASTPTPCWNEALWWLGILAPNSRVSGVIYMAMNCPE